MAQHRHDANVQSEKLNNFSDSNGTTVALFYKSHVNIVLLDQVNNSNGTTVALFYNYFIFKSNVNIVLLEQVNDSKSFERKIPLHCDFYNKDFV